MDAASPAASKYEYYFYNTVSPGLPISKHLSSHSRASTSDHGMQRRAIVRRVSAYRNREINHTTPLSLSLAHSLSQWRAVPGGPLAAQRRESIHWKLDLGTQSRTNCGWPPPRFLNSEQGGGAALVWDAPPIFKESAVGKIFIVRAHGWEMTVDGTEGGGWIEWLIFFLPLFFFYF